jgi:ribosomal protein L31E
MKPSKKQVEAEEKQLRTGKIVRSSKSNKRLAEFLVKHYPNDAQKIADGLERAATEKGIKRRLKRLKTAVESESAESSAA